MRQHGGAFVCTGTDTEKAGAASPRSRHGVIGSEGGEPDTRSLTGGGETVELEIGRTGKIGRGSGNEIFVSVEHLAQHLMQDRVDLPAEHGRFSSPESLDAGAPDGLSPA